MRACLSVLVLLALTSSSGSVPSPSPDKEELPSMVLYDSKDYVEEIEEEEYNRTVIESDDVWIVEFYAPWCVVCQSVAPGWKKVANALRGIVHIAAVDANTHKNFLYRYKITMYPAIAIFAKYKQSPRRYKGPRTPKPMLLAALNTVKDFVMGRLGDMEVDGVDMAATDAVVPLTDGDFEDMVVRSDHLWLVEFCSPRSADCQRLAPMWTQVAAALKGVVKVGTVDVYQYKSLGEQYRIRDFPTIMIFGNDKKVPQEYKGDLNAHSILTAVVDTVEEVALFRMGGASMRREL